VERELQYGNLQVHSDPKGLINGASVFDSFLSPREGRMWARPIPSNIVDILSTFVGPSVCLFVEKLTPMGSDFDEHGEEAHTDPLVENLDDAGKYISVWEMSKEGILALPHPIRGYCHESFGIRENHNRLVVGEGIFKSQTRCRKFGPAGRATTDASPNPAALTSFGMVPVKTCSHSGAAFRTVRGIDNPKEVVDVHQA